MRQSRKSRGYAGHPFWQAVGLLVLAYVFIVYVIPLFPGSSIVPKSVVLQYMLTVLVGVLILSGAVNTAIIGSNGVLNRVAEDGVEAVVDGSEGGNLGERGGRGEEE